MPSTFRKLAGFAWVEPPGYKSSLDRTAWTTAYEKAAAEMNDAKRTLKKGLSLEHHAMILDDAIRLLEPQRPRGMRWSDNDTSRDSRLTEPIDRLGNRRQR